MVPVRTRIDHTRKWVDFAKELQIAVAGCLDHSVYPFTALVRELNVARSADTSPIFQAAFTYRKYFSGDTLKMMQARYADTLPFELVAGLHQEGEYDLRLEVSEEYDGLHFYLKFNPDLFRDATIAQMMRHYLNLVNEVVGDPTAPLHQLFSPTEAEQNAVREWNRTEVLYAQDPCVHTLFEQQVCRTPDAVAVVFENDSLTYRQLDDLSDALCASLQRGGARPGDLVGIYVERSFGMIVGLLAILKSGGAYVPLDPGFPAERLQHLIKDSGVRCILTQDALAGRLDRITEGSVATVLLDRGGIAADDGIHSPASRTRTETTGEQLAYVLYTSGSTGNPKGVMITHRAFSNVLLAMLEKPGLRVDDRLLAITTYCFDIAGLELFGPLIKGACCVICPSETARDAERLKHELRRARATVMQATPVVWMTLFQSGWRNEERLKVLCGGEALPERLRARFIECGCEAWNLFGPTETTIWSTVQRIEKDGPRGIGQPLANTRVYIVDNNFRMTPLGIAGELCIAGNGLARGYHNKPDLTAERFVDNPFEPGGKLYRTGDVARWLPDGTIEYLGRADEQVKLRGHRIELAEIELRLGAHPGIANCAVVLKASDEHMQLVAYYVAQPAGKQALDARKLREYLRAKLPDYMVPALFVEADHIPLTPNRKVDRKKLSQRDVPRTDPAADSAPDTEIEKRITRIWKSVIGNDDIGVDDGFFDAGGDSVLAITVAHKIRTELNCDFSVTTLFKHANVRAISKYIAESRPDPAADPTSVAPASDVIEPGGAVAAGAADGTRTETERGAAAIGHPEYYRSSVAIIGISCHFPGAENQYEFWSNLLGGREGVERLSSAEIEKLGLTERAVRDPNYVAARSTIRGKDLFDPAFFKISPRDAELMDPQLRLLLLHAWKAVEDAGYVPAQMPDTGVFMSASSTLYGARAPQSSAKRDGVLLNSATYQSWLLSQSGTIPTMISYKLGLRGPSYYVHSNCSSSLVGLQLACQTIMRGEATQALVGAATLLPYESLGYIHEEGLHFSSDGSIRTFDASADGMIGGEGVAVILVKKALDAVRDGDHIYALVRGVSLNNDGSDKAGFYAPSVSGQADVICRAFKETGVDPETISYVEAHGTGTPLGDPIEFSGLCDAFRRYTKRAQFCGLGSVKSNIGHMDTAAGLAGVIKVALALQQGEIPRSINFSAINPKIELEGSPFYVMEANKRLDRVEHPHRAALSSFGMGGTNAHAILEQPPADERTQENVATAGLKKTIKHLVPLSARNEERLKEYAANLLKFISERSIAGEGATPAGLNLADVAYTLQVGREAMDSRLGMIVDSVADLESKLRRFVAGDESVEDLYRGQVRREKEMVVAFSADDDFQHTITKWIERGKYGKLLDLWVKGLLFDWRQLYGAAKPRRISLPTYPFARERYWVMASETKASAAVGSLQADTSAVPGGLDAEGLRIQPELRVERDLRGTPDSREDEAFELLTFEEVWQEHALSEHAAGNVKTIVCFLSDLESQRTVVDAVVELSAHTRIIFVAQNAEDGKPSQGHYAVRHGDINDYREALDGIRAGHGEVDALLYLWPLEDPGHLQDATSIVRILQAMASVQLRCRRVLLVGDFASGLERSHLESWVGFERSLGLVWPQTKVTILGQERKLHGTAATRECMLRLWGELLSEKAESALFLAGKRHVCRIRPRPLEATRSLLRHGGTYLITGGCGGLGLLFAEHLARTLVANLVLCGRSAPDEETRNRIKALNAYGSKVLYVQADVCDESKLSDGLKEAQARFGALHGVIHAAGINGGGSVFDNDIERFRQALAPKVQGTLVLDRLLHGKPLDFICYFSSSAAVLGDFGCCDYAIGNRFLMAHARNRNEEREPGEQHNRRVVINWGLWKHGGMQVGDVEHTDMYLKTSGQRALETEEGIAAFDRLLGQPAVQHLVLAGQPTRVHRFLGMAERSGAAARGATSPTSEAVGAGRRAEMNGLSVSQCVTWDLKAFVGRLLSVPGDRLDMEENLADFGFDSISLTQLAHQLTSHYGFEITPALFFNYPTLERLTKYFLDAHAAAMEAFYQKEAAPPTRPAPAERHRASPSPQRADGRSRDFDVSTVASAAAAPSEQIAIIGMSGRFPKARTVDDFWASLVDGMDAVEEIPADRFDWRQYYGDPRSAPDKTDCKWSGFVPGVAEFDPLFFEISPREAELMDPRQRLLLMESWKALEDAGYGPTQLRAGEVGMFVGVEHGDYQLLRGDVGGITANHEGVLAGRLAYFLDLHGPTMAINTTCSSALVALHQACASLRNSECATAVVGGVNLLLAPEIYIRASQAGMLSKDGKCYAFDRRANGMVPGEAVVAVVLKLLSRAEADGDPIYAVIRGSGINYDGKTNGITAPSGLSQASLLRDVYDRHQINPEDIEYIVTHGTGTKLGDPIEINALYDAFKGYTNEQRFCALTSIKTNTGHTLAASGLVSLIGLVEALRNELIPASLHCEEPNDYINWQASPFYINRANKPWPARVQRRRLGAVSAFGMSGTNAHAVVASYEASEVAAEAKTPPYFLLVLSAKTEAALQQKTEDLIEILEKKDWSPHALLEMSYTLLCGRQHFAHRCAIVVRDRAGAIHAWRQLGKREHLPHVFQGQTPRNFAGHAMLRRHAEDLLARSEALIADEESYQENLFVLADLYCQGYGLKWERLYGAQRPRRISLPSYPFAKERYWVPAGGRGAAAVAGPRAGALH
ncbi:MAG TPA: amino acid adenylation domain-containing protein, partial [Bradyrhizobium sp.]|nr:amino acid adenylation domain-containing protein [Bradyrhizobium sp.]